MQKVNKKIIKRWVEALRSGKYPQCREKLNDGTGMCCLGVIADLRLQDQGLKWQKHTEESGFFAPSLKNLETGCDKEFFYTTKPTRSWARFDVKELKFDYDLIKPFLTPEQIRKADNNLLDRKTTYQPACLNDDLGCTFDQIADILEAAFLKGD